MAWRRVRSRELGLGRGFPQTFLREMAAEELLLKRMQLDTRLREHTGCVNHLSFSEQGDLMVSGSDDTQVCIWDVARRKLRFKYMSGHSANIFCTRFLPDLNNAVLASCAGDGEVRVHRMDTGADQVFQCHSRRVKKLVTERGNPNLLLSASEDGTVRQIDLRLPHDDCTSSGTCHNVLVDLRTAPHKVQINSISLAAHAPQYFAVGGSDLFVRVYDRRMLSPAAEHSDSRSMCIKLFSPRGTSGFDADHITGVSFSSDGTEVLGSYGSNHVYLFAMDGSCISHEPESQLQFNGPVEDNFIREARRRGLVAHHVQRYTSAITHFTRAITMTHAASLTAQVRAGCTQGECVVSRQLTCWQHTVPVHNLPAFHITVSLGASCLQVPSARARSLLAALYCSRCSSYCLRQEAGDYGHALADADKALELARCYGKGHYWRARSLAGLGRPAEALEAATVATSLCFNEDLQDLLTHLQSIVSVGGRDRGSQDAERPGQASVHAVVDGEWASEACEQSLSAGDVGLQNEVPQTSSPAANPLLMPSPNSSEDSGVGSSDTSGSSTNDSEDESASEAAASGDSDVLAFEWGDMDNACSVDAVNDSAEHDLAEANTSTSEGDSAVPLFKQCYQGHCNVQTVKDVCFYGPRHQYVMSGSDDGRIFIWAKDSGKLVMLLNGDRHVVNCIQGHPFDPLIASCGIENSVKLWAPIAPHPAALRDAERVMAQNESRRKGSSGSSARMTLALFTLVQSLR